jgi:sensor domain CHASE-containing protein
MAGFVKVEKEDSERNVKRVLDAFTEIVNNLSIKASDWAKWDDTYRFIEDKNQDYIQSNLTDEALTDLKLNIINRI